MFNSFNAPVAELIENTLIRRAGLFYRKRIQLNEIERVVAVIRDAVTHEEIMAGFFDVANHAIWLSEFDKNFLEVMKRLESRLPGFVGVENFVSRKPFEKTERVLWSRLG